LFVNGFVNLHLLTKYGHRIYTKTTTYMTYRRVCNKSNMAGATCGAGTAYFSEAPELTVFL